MAGTGTTRTGVITTGSTTNQRFTFHVNGVWVGGSSLQGTATTTGGEIPLPSSRTNDVTVNTSTNAYTVVAR